MEISNTNSKPEPEKSDERAPSKIPPATKASSISMRPGASRIARSASASQSKIPKCDIGMLKKNIAPEYKIAVRVTKPMDNKKSSISSVSLGLAKTPRQNSIISSRSNMLTRRAVKSKDLTPRSNNSDQAAEKHQKAADRIAAKRNILAFENMKEKVKNFQTEFLKKWEQVKDNLPTDEGEYKLIGLVKNNDGQLMTKTPQKIKIKSGSKSLDDFKKDVQSHIQNNLSTIAESLDQLKCASCKVGDNPSKGYECLSAIEDVKKKIKLNTLGDILKQIDSFETEAKQTTTAVPSLPSIDSSINSELESKMNKLMKEVDELKTNLEQSQKELSRIRKSNEDKDVSHKKELEERDKKLNKKQSELEEVKRKHESTEREHMKEKTSIKDLSEKLDNKSAEVEDLKKKLKSYAQTKTVQLNTIQEHEARIKNLQFDLEKALKDIDKRAQMEHSIGDQATKQADEIKALKTDLVNMKKERERMEKEIQHLKKEAEEKTYLDKKYRHADVEIQSLRQTIRDLEIQVQENKSQVNHNRDFQEELAKIQKSDNDKAQKIEVLEMELNKAHFQIQKLEEKIVMDRKLLKVRCSLIESLQTKESTQKTHLEDLFAEVGERNNDIQMLKSELISKNEEFQSLFATLSAKQLELTRQEHMIKLLQESNERAQTLRVKQEAKIGRLEDEIAQLKQTISLYQDAVLPNNALRKNLMMAESNRDNDANDPVGYYVDERRRKRHIDITVKKYEK